MKLLTILMTFAFIQLSTRALSQISLSGNDMKLADVFHAIQRQSGYSFFYKDKLVENITVSPDVHNADLDGALRQVLHGLPLSYTIVGHTVVINQAAPVAPANPERIVSFVLTGNLTDTL